MHCPEHKTITMVRSKWTPPDGFDPLMTRFACIECLEYWFKAPRNHQPERWNEICRQQGLIPVSE